MNNISKFTSIIYAVLLLSGGIMGYLKAHSTISLITGLISGILILLSYVMSNKNPKAGYLYIAAISLWLGVFFLNRYMQTYIFMPSGLMFLMSMTTFVIVGLGYFKIKK